MEVTSAVHSVRFLHLQTRFSQLERLNNNNNNNGPLFISTKTTTQNKYNSLLHTNQLSRKNNSGYGLNYGSNSKSVIINSTSSATTSAETSGSLSEVEKIKQKCLKWKWKDQYSINYFVSSDSESSQLNHPPLLLVHGFGASIPHWRRYVCYHSHKF
jgi:hypothetical protein